MAQNRELLSRIETGVLYVTLNRPEKRNALSRALLTALRDAFNAHAGRDDLLAAVLVGAGDQAFCAGGDLRDLADTRDRVSAEQFAVLGTAALDAIRNFPLPVIAALNGRALGGGAELALACDLRIAAAHAGIGFIHSTLHIATAWGGGADLMHLLGPNRALEILVHGTTLSADVALQAGIFNQVAGAGADFTRYVEDYVAPIRQRHANVLRALKAQAIAERGIPAQQRAADQARFVETWIHPDHWTAVGKALK